MRSAIIQHPEARTAREQRQVLRAALRKLDRVDTDLTAVAHMRLDDLAAQRLLNHLRTDVDSLRRYIGMRRDRAGE
jgi:hypothetical protein